MNSFNSYVLDRESIKLDAYRLLCLFYANKEISRRTDPAGKWPDGSAHLERQYLGREVTRLLLTIAIALRTLDDQMNGLDREDPGGVRYRTMREVVNRTRRVAVPDELSLRQACNKIIHASSVAAVTKSGTEEHAFDAITQGSWLDNYDPDDPTSKQPGALAWTHLSEHVALSGEHRGKEWAYRLDVPVFVAAIYELLTNRVVVDGGPS